MAKRMALVPLEMAGTDYYQRMGQVQEAPLLNKLAGLDAEMGNILRDASMSDDLKFKKYQDALRRYQHFSDVRDERPKQQQLPDPIQSSASQQIIGNMPRPKQRSARILLDFMDRIPELSVNARNEIAINDNVIKHSNVHDLVSDLTRDKKGPKPIGYKELAQLLKDHNIPMDAIGSSFRKNAFRQDEIIEPLPSVRPSISKHMPSRPLSNDDFAPGASTHSRFNVLDNLDDDNEPKKRKSRRISIQGPRTNYASLLNSPFAWQTL